MKRNTSEAELEAYLAKGNEITHCAPRILLHSQQVNKMKIWREQHPNFGRAASDFGDMSLLEIDAKIAELQAQLKALEEGGPNEV